MKRRLTKLTSLFLVAAMAFSLCACGGGSDSSNKSDSETPEYIYSSEFNTIAKDSDKSYNPLVYTANGYYASSYEALIANQGVALARAVGTMAEDSAEPVAEADDDLTVMPVDEGGTVDAEGEAADDSEAAEEKEETYVSNLYFVGFDGTISKLEAYTPTAIDSENAENRDYNSSSNIAGAYLNSEGKLVIIDEVYEFWSTAPEDITDEDEAYWDYREYTDTYYIRVLDTDGSEISRSAIEVPEDRYLYVYNACLDANDNLIVSSDDGVAVIGPDGSYKNILVERSNPNDYFYVSGTVKLPDGRAAAMCSGSTGNELRVVDVAAGAFGESYALPGSAYNAISGGGDYDVYYTSGTSFYGYKLETAEETKLFNWINLGINGDNATGISVMDDGSICCMLNEYHAAKNADGSYREGTYDVTIATVSLVPSSSVPVRESITMATQYLDWNIRDTIIKFNRENPSYCIELNDYSEYNTEEDYNAGLTKLTTELLAGNVPDIIDLSNMPYTQLAAKGLLEDLYPYIDADSEFSRDDFFQNVLQAYEVNGSLYATVPGFYIYTAIGAASVVGDEPGWTYDEFEEALSSMPEGCDPFDQYTTRDTILNYCLSLDMNNFVDWTTGKCNFDSDSFKELLEFAAQFPEEFDWDNYEYTEEDNTANRIASGRQMLTASSIWSLEDIFYNDYYFGGESTYIGYPTYDGHPGSLIGSSGGAYAMSAKSEHKDIVWNFLREFFTEDYQRDQYYLPTNINVYNSKLKDAMTIQYQKNADGSFRLDENGEKIPVVRGSMGSPTGEVVDFYALSQEQADKLWDVLTSTTCLMQGFSGNNSILDIVTEQAAAYFAGQKSVDEVAKLVQSKANIYVNEQR